MYANVVSGSIIVAGPHPTSRRPQTVIPGITAKVSDPAEVAVSTSLVLFDDFRNELRTIDFLDCNIVDAPGWTTAAF